MEKIELSPGNIVMSLKGHDTGNKYLVIGLAGKEFVLIADGKGRTVEKPKLKRAKHLKFLSDGEVEKFTQLTDLNINNSDIATILRKF